MEAQRGTSRPPRKAGKARELRNTDVVTWEIPGYGEVAQDPLTFFEKNEFLGLVATAIDKAIADGIDIEGIATAVTFDDDTAKELRKHGIAAARDLPGVDKLIQAGMRVLAQTPSLMEDAYLVILSIPPADRDFVRGYLAQIDDDTGFGILDTFLRQNLTTLRDFALRWWEQVTGANQRLTPEKTEKTVTAESTEPTPTSND